MTVNRDVGVAAVLLVLWGAFWVAAGDIEQTNYSAITSDVWPRLVLVALIALTFAYLIQALRGVAGGAPAPSEAAAPPAGTAGGRFASYRNPLLCFALFLLFLVTLPWLGMLLGGTLFVFLLLGALGGWTPALIARHAAVAVGTIGFMWLVFTFGLHVFLPEGELIDMRELLVRAAGGR